MKYLTEELAKKVNIIKQHRGKTLGEYEKLLIRVFNWNRFSHYDIDVARRAKAESEKILILNDAQKLTNYNQKNDIALALINNDFYEDFFSLPENQFATLGYYFVCKQVYGLLGCGVDDIPEEEVSKALGFIYGLEELISSLPNIEAPGRYIYTNYSPDRQYMESLAQKTKNSMYYGLAVSDTKHDEIQTFVSSIEQSTLDLIIKYKLAIDGDVVRKHLVNLYFRQVKECRNANTLSAVYYTPKGFKNYSFFINNDLKL